MDKNVRRYSVVNEAEDNKDIEQTMGRGLGTIRLTAFAIGSTLAAGVFSLSGDMAAEGANTGAVLVGWLITGIGMFGLMMCFYELNRVRPDLTSGIFSYAREGFGEYIGFNAAWGYWISAMLANVAFAAFLFSSIGFFFPVFGEGNNWPSMICASIIIWFTVVLVLRGVGQAASINLIVVIAKVLPILVLIVAIVMARGFHWSIFTENFTGDGTMTFFEQVRSTIFTTVWVFIGIEGAVVISGRGKDTKTAGRATVIAFMSLLALYLTISILSMGVLTTEQLAELGNPPMAGVLEAVVGHWGAVLVNIAVIISVGGAMYTYTMLSAESSFAPGAKKLFPKIFTKENKNGAPMGSLIISTAVVQIFLIIVVFSEGTFQIVYFISGSMIMLPYFLSGLFYLKLRLKGEGVDKDVNNKGMTWVYAAIGTLYGLWLLYASGIDYILTMAFLYAPGVFVYIFAKKQNGLNPFAKKLDLAVLIVILVLAVLSIILLANGTIHVL